MTAVHGEPRPANLGQGWTVDDSTFGARLALVRQRMQWNIKEAARECGIPAASWGTWENGAMPRRYTEMCRLISDRTGCDFVWLATGPVRSAGETNDRSDHLLLPAAPIGKRHVTPRPIGQARRDSSRPVSAIPASRRRPTMVRSPGRPMQR